MAFKFVSSSLDCETIDRSSPPSLLLIPGLPYHRNTGRTRDLPFPLRLPLTNSIVVRLPPLNPSMVLCSFLFDCRPTRNSLELLLLLVCFVDVPPVQSVVKRNQSLDDSRHDRESSVLHARLTSSTLSNQLILGEFLQLLWCSALNKIDCGHPCCDGLLHRLRNHAL